MALEDQWATLRGASSRALDRTPLVIRSVVNRLAMAEALRRARVTGPAAAPTMLFFNHFFDQDVRALELAATKVRLMIVDAPSAFRFTRKLFPSAVADLLEPYDTAPSEARAAHRAACRSMLRSAVERFGVKAIGATNDSFFWYRECLTVAEALGIKRIVIDKEGTISPNDWTYEAERLRRNAPFRSERIYVWSARQDRFWTSIGAPPESVVIAGQPRSDLLFRPDETRLPRDVPGDRPLVTLFAFALDAYVPFGVPQREVAWKGLMDGCLDAVAAAASAAPSAFFVVKLHPQDPAEAYCRSRVGSLPNVQVRRDSESAYALLVHSRAVVAFQTTVTLEAGPLGKPILYPSWAELERTLSDALLPLRTMPHVQLMSSANELRERLIDAVSASPSFPLAVPAAPNEYLERCDGSVASRILTDVARLIS